MTVDLGTLAWALVWTVVNTRCVLLLGRMLEKDPGWWASRYRQALFGFTAGASFCACAFSLADWRVALAQGPIWLLWWLLDDNDSWRRRKRQAGAVWRKAKSYLAVGVPARRAMPT